MLTFGMIRISQQNSAKDAKRYHAADYYSEGQELVGSWGGKGATRLGLSGTVDKSAFESLCDNLDPRTGEPLTVRTRSERTVGYDFTFSVPKSISLLYALSGDQEILQAFREAVNETMVEMEAEMKTRVRMGGQDVDRTTGNLTWAEFIHTTSRPVDGLPDPHLHAHVFVFNTTFDEEEDRWKAGQFRELKRDAPYFQAAFRVRLANKIQDLGFGVTRKRDDFEITGIRADVLKRFSRRTTIIEKVAEERGIDDPGPEGRVGGGNAGAESQVALAGPRSVRNGSNGSPGGTRFARCGPASRDRAHATGTGRSPGRRSRDRPLLRPRRGGPRTQALDRGPETRPWIGDGRNDRRGAAGPALDPQ